MGHIEIYARRTDELGDDDSLCAVDNKGAAVGHDGELTHKYLGLLYCTRLLVEQTHSDAHGGCIGSVALLALLHGVFSLLVNAIVYKGQHPVAGVVGDFRYVAEHLLESGVEKPFVRVLLNLDEIGHLHDFFDLAEAHARGRSFFDGLNIQHRPIHSVLFSSVSCYHHQLTEADIPFFGAIHFCQLTARASSFEER